MNLPCQHALARGLVLALFLVPHFTVQAVAQTPAESTLQKDTSLAFVPADVAFYTGVYRMRDQCDRFRASNAYKKVKSHPLVQLGLMQLRNKWNDSDETRQVKAILEREEVQSALALGKEAVSTEMFWYADREVVRLFELLGQFSQMSNRIQLSNIKSGDDGGDEMQKQIIAEVVKMSQGFEVPHLVWGFRIVDTARAQQLLDQAEPLLHQALSQVPELAGNFKREKIGDGEYLLLTLNGGMIPWDKLEREAADEGLDDSVRQLKANLADKQLVLSLGLRGKSILLTLTNSAGRLKVDSSRDLLIQRDEFARVREHADRLMVSIGYASKEVIAAAARTDQQLQDTTQAVELLIEQIDEISEDIKKEIVKDTKEMISDLREYIPEYGAVASFEYMTDFGYEGYVQNWTVKKGLDGSKPLEILNHVGGQPLGMIAGRSHAMKDCYLFASKWASRAALYVDRLQVREKLDEDDRDEWDKYTERIVKLAKRFDQITRDNMLPALADGQMGLVFDARRTSVRWHKEMPEAADPLPLPELTVLHGVSDVAKLRLAMVDYWSFGGEVVSFVQEFIRDHEEEIRDDADDEGQKVIDAILTFQWQFPQIEKTAGGEVFQLPIDESWGFDAQVSPSLGFTEDVLVASATKVTVTNLMQADSLSVGGALADTSRPLVAASSCDFSGFIEMLKPWISYGIDVGESTGKARGAAMVEPQLTPFLDVAQCIKSFTSATSIEDGSLLMHYQWRFEDSEEAEVKP
ncbi:MAG: hypothetical protein KDA60_08270 [Planctomycetales bacterium]|nr:hypothetical protein [Planctomycetales bacterium]